MKKKIATIILNRNLPKQTDKLFNYIKKYNNKFTDIFILESGSDINNLSKNYTWRAGWKSAIKNGLRFSRGMNYALSKLWSEKKFEKYCAFFLITNDTEIKTKFFAKKIIKILDQHPRLGIISPCSKYWGERKLLNKNKIKYSWYFQNTAYVFRKDLVKDIMNLDKPHYKKFLFDGSNFRGWGAISEVIAKSYNNDWAAGITSELWTEENETYLKNLHKQIKTESYEKNYHLVIEETNKWMKNKFGFSNKWSMQMYVKAFYDKFFKYYPEYIKFKL